MPIYVEASIHLTMCCIFFWASKIWQKPAPQNVPLTRINARILRNFGLHYYAENVTPIMSVLFFVLSFSALLRGVALLLLPSEALVDI